jgi:hypothetical protein
MASLEPKLFCGVALYGREGITSARECVGTVDTTNRDASHLRHNNCQPALLLIGRATPPHRQNLLDVALLPSDCLSETADYTDGGGVCQATRPASPRISQQSSNGATEKRLCLSSFVPRSRIRGNTLLPTQVFECRKSSILN